MIQELRNISSSLQNIAKNRINSIKKQFQRTPEQKSDSSYGNARFLSWYDAASRGGNDLKAFIALRLADETSVVNTAVDIITREFGILKLQLKNRKTNAVMLNHPVLDLLNSPNPVISGKLFMIELASFYLVTGNTYIIATGNISQPPLELFLPFPQSIIIQQGRNDTFPDIYEVTSDTNLLRFSRREVERKFRFYNGPLQEIKQIRGYNSRQGSLYGNSPLNSIFPEIEQFNESSIHNLALLLNGARPSGVLMFSGDGEEEALTDDQYMRLKAEFNNMYTGSSNAGRVLIAEGSSGVHYQDMMINNRDMDFLKLKENVENKIYNRLGIPLPLVMQGRQTFDNLKEARELLYDNTILPLADVVLDEMTAFLLPRYKDLKDWFITYNESDIPALRGRRVRELVSRSKLGIYSTNELRTQDGSEAISGKEGDIIYHNSNLIALGSDRFTEDQRRVITEEETQRRLTEEEE